MKVCLEYISQKYGEYYEKYEEICNIFKPCYFYKKNEPIIILVTFDLNNFQKEYGKHYNIDIKYWLYYRMFNEYDDYVDWYKYEMIDFNKMLRTKKLERICDEREN